MYPAYKKTPACDIVTYIHVTPTCAIITYIHVHVGTCIPVKCIVYAPINGKKPSPVGNPGLINQT